jgi:hypothetical protein
MNRLSELPKRVRLELADTLVLANSSDSPTGAVAVSYGQGVEQIL